MIKKAPVLAIVACALIPGCGLVSESFDGHVTVDFDVSTGEHTFDFAVSPNENTTTSNETTSYGLTVLRRARDGSEVSLNAESLPPGATVSFAPARLAPDQTTSTMAIKTAPGTVNAIYSVTVRASESGLSPEANALNARNVRLVVSDPPPGLSCQRTPPAGPAPLSVSFGAQPSYCAGCPFTWDFGDGTPAIGRAAQHVYSQPGVYTAVGTLSNPLGPGATCTKSIEVSSPAPRESPLPPSRNHPPSISAPALTYLGALEVRITATVSDPDPEDTLAWQVEVVSAPEGSVFKLTPLVGSGTNLETLFSANALGSYTVRIRARDRDGAEAMRDLTIVLGLR
jgi:PKD repeat protein